MKKINGGLLSFQNISKFINNDFKDHISYFVYNRLLKNGLKEILQISLEMVYKKNKN